MDPLKSNFYKKNTDIKIDLTDLPERPDESNLCARGVCRQPGAVFYNYGSYNWYCRNCAHKINLANGEICFLGKEKI